MTILALADRPPRQSIRQTVSDHAVDMICTLGDLEYFDILELQDITHIPKIGVYGNHCSGAYMEDLGIMNVHLHTFTYNGLTFGGFEGSVKYKETTRFKMYSQEEATALLANFPRVDVMLCHCPPYGINDDTNEISHSGFHALRDYVEQQKPSALLHGHTYPTADTLISQVGETRIIYVHADAVITI